jgi:PRC-barrel domain
MTVLKPARLLGTVAVLATIPLFSAIAQTTSPAPGNTSPPPAAAKPDATLPTQPKAAPPASTSDKAATAPAKVDPLVGRSVISSDGSKLSSVQSVVAGPDGKVTAIHLKTGAILGLGGKLVAIPAGKFTRDGDTIKLSMTADDVSKLPEAKEVK